MSENPPARSPGCTFFLKKVDDDFQLSPSKHMPSTPFHRQNKTNKAVRYGNIFYFLFTLLPKQYAGLGRAESELEPGRWIFQPGYLTLV